MLGRRRQWARRSRKTVRKCLSGARRLAVSAEGHELDLEPLVRLRSAIETPMKSDERPAAESRRKLRPVVEEHPVRRPMRTERQERLIEAGAVDTLRTADAMSIATVLGGEHFLVLGDRVEIAIRPAVVAAACHAHELLRGKVCALILRVELRPVLEEHVPALLYRVESAVAGIDRERDEISIPGREVRPRCLRLVRPLGVEDPHASADRKLRTWEDSR